MYSKREICSKVKFTMLTLNRMTGQANKSQDKLAGKTLATGNLTGKLCLKHDQELKSNRNFPVKTGGKLALFDN